MQTLSNGYKLPEDGDFGDVWFPALADDIQRLNDHDHDGTNSEKLSSANFEVAIVSVASGDFTDQGDGYSRATVSVPGGNALANFSITVRDQTTLEQIYVKTALATLTTVYIYTNTVQAMDVVFGV